MSKRFQVLGVNDEANSCDCCGKQGLKKVVWIQDLETQEIQHFGVVCAQNPIKGFSYKVQVEIKDAANRWEWLRKEAKQILKYTTKELREKAATMRGWFVDESGNVKTNKNLIFCNIN